MGSGRRGGYSSKLRLPFGTISTNQRKKHLHWCTSSHKVTSPKPPQATVPTRDKAFKYLRYLTLGYVLIKTAAGTLEHSEVWDVGGIRRSRLSRQILTTVFTDVFKLLVWSWYVGVHGRERVTTLETRDDAHTVCSFCLGFYQGVQMLKKGGQITRTVV